MKIQNILWPGLALVLAVALGVFVGQSKDENLSKTVIVKTYKVPVSRVGEAKGALSRLFRSSKHASAQALGDGLLLVRIPKSYEQGVDDLIQEFQKTSSYSNQKIRMDYWILRGSSKELDSEVDKSHGLNKIIGVINAQDGKQHFQVLEHLSTDSSLGRGVKIKGWLAEIESHIAPSEMEDVYSMALTFDSRFGKVETNTSIQDGSFIVLAQSAANKSRLGNVLSKSPHELAKPIEGENKIYFIVKGTKTI